MGRFKLYQDKKMSFDYYEKFYPLYLLRKTIFFVSFVPCFLGFFYNIILEMKNSYYNFFIQLFYYIYISYKNQKKSIFMNQDFPAMMLFVFDMIIINTLNLVRFVFEKITLIYNPMFSHLSMMFYLFNEVGSKHLEPMVLISIYFIYKYIVRQTKFMYFFFSEISSKHNYEY